MKTEKLLPRMALLFAGAGIVLRAVHFYMGFEFGTGLPVNGALWSGVLVGWLLASIVVFWTFARPLHARRNEPFESLLGTKNVWFRVALVVAGLLLVAGGVWYGMLTRADTEEVMAVAKILGYVYAVATVLAGGSLLVICKMQGMQQVTPAAARALLLPVIWGCLHLLVSYRLACIDPKLPSYAPSLLADAFVALALYQLARMLFGRPRPTQFAICAAVAVSLSVADLGGYFIAWALGARSIIWSMEAVARGGLSVAMALMLFFELRTLTTGEPAPAAVPCPVEVPEAQEPSDVPEAQEPSDAPKAQEPLKAPEPLLEPEQSETEQEEN